MSDDYQSIPVAVARAAVQASGELEGIDGPEFSLDGESWSPYWFGHSEPPALGRVTVYRRGQKPRAVVISWAEREASDEEDAAWSLARSEKPMSIFGAEVERHAYRVVFADVLAPLLAPTRIITGVESPQSWEPRNDRLMVVPDAEAVVRDWSAEVKAADAAKLNALYDEARDAGALLDVDGLQQAFTDRMLELSAAPKPKPAPRPSVTDKLAPKGKPNRRRRPPRAENA